MIQLSEQLLLSYITSGIHHTAPVFHVKIYRTHVISRATSETLDDKVIGFAVVLEGRKPAARLDISGTPGVEQLRPMEREVCTNYSRHQDPVRRLDNTDYAPGPDCSKAG